MVSTTPSSRENAAFIRDSPYPVEQPRTSLADFGSTRFSSPKRTGRSELGFLGCRHKKSGAAGHPRRSPPSWWWWNRHRCPNSSFQNIPPSLACPQPPGYAGHRRPGIPPGCGTAAQPGHFEGSLYTGFQGGNQAVDGNSLLIPGLHCRTHGGEQMGILRVHRGFIR